MNNLFKSATDLRDFAVAKLRGDLVEDFYLSLSLNNVEWVTVGGVADAKSVNRKS
jgi:hypothetical protein